MKKIIGVLIAINLNLMAVTAGADAQVKDVTGGNKMDQEAIYILSNQIQGEVKGNDAAALKKALASAQKDPQKFLETLSPELQKQIRELAERIEDRQKDPP